MMFFFDTVQTFSTTGKSAKGKALQEMAMRFKDVLVQGEDAIVEILSAMRGQTQEIDIKYKKGRLTFIDLTLDESDESGVITALPVSDVIDFDTQPYFRIYFHRVARTATIPEAIEIVKGGVL